MQVKKSILPLAIASCSNVYEALIDQNQACSNLIRSMSVKGETDVEALNNMFNLKRPVPWIGEFGRAQILFLIPRLSLIELHNFPTWDPSIWTNEDIEEFYFQQEEIGKDAFQHLGYKNGQEQGELDFQNSKVQSVSSSDHSYLSFVNKLISGLFLDSEDSRFLSPHFVIAPIVHCPAKNISDLQLAAPTCSKRWLRALIENSKARVIVSVGSIVGAALALCFPKEVPGDWGKWNDRSNKYGKGFWPSNLEQLQTQMENTQWGFSEQKKNSFVLESCETQPLVIFVGSPGGGSLSSPNRHPSLFCSEYREYIKSHISGPNESNNSN